MPPPRAGFFVEVRVIPGPFPEPGEEMLALHEKYWQTLVNKTLDPMLTMTPFKRKKMMSHIAKTYVKRMCNHAGIYQYCIARHTYEKLEAFLRSKCRDIFLPTLTGKPGLRLLKNTVKAWRTYLKRKKKFVMIFAAVDKCYTSLAVSIPSSVNDVRTMFRNCFIEEVYKKVAPKLREYIFHQLERKRAGHGMTIDAPYYLAIFQALILGLGNFKHDFVEEEYYRHIRENSYQYLVSQKDHFDQSCICSFIKSAYTITHEIEVLRMQCIPFCMRPFIHDISKIRDDLFFADNGAKITHLLENQKLQALSQLRKTFQTDKKFMRKVGTHFESYVKEITIPKMNESLGDDPSPAEFFTGMFFTWAKVYNMITQGLEGNFSGLRDNILVEALRRPFCDLFRAKGDQLLTEQLVLFFDEVLIKNSGRKSMIKGKTIAQEVEIAVALSDVLPSFDAFVEEYRTRLASFICTESFEMKHADMFLKALTKNFLHSEEVNKLSGMISMVTMKAENDAAFTPTTNDASTGSDSSQIRVETTRVVRRCDWPIGPSVQLKLPEELIGALKKYTEFLEVSHEEKKLDYNFAADRVIVSTSLFGSKETKLHLTTHQMCILELFQKVDSMTISEILQTLEGSGDSENSNATATELQEAALRCLRSLMTEDCPILKKVPDSTALEEEDVVRVNTDFVPQTSKILVPLA